MTDWYFSNPEPDNYFQWAQQGRDGTTPETAWTLDPTRTTYEGHVDFSLIQEGDTLWILDYHDWTSFGVDLNLTVRNNYTIRGDYPGRPGRISVIRLYSTTNITIKNLEIARVYYDGAHGMTLDGCEIHGASKGIHGTVNSHMDNVTIKNCEIHDCPNEGIEVFAYPAYSRDNWVFSDNHIYNVGVSGGYPTADAEGLGLQRITNCSIIRNHIHHCDYGINIYEEGLASVNNILIDSNIIHDCLTGPSAWQSRGILFSGGSSTLGSHYNIQITNNIIYNIGKEAIRAAALPAGSTGLVCCKNLIANVNVEFGTPHTEPAVMSSDWDMWGNIYQYTYQSNIYEILIAASDFGSVSEGDVIDVRFPLGYMGKEEQKLFLSLIVESDMEISDLKKRNYNGNKYGTYVVLEELNDSPYNFNLDLSQVRDQDNAYQPYLNIDVSNGVYRDIPITTNIDSIVYSK